MGGRQFPPEFLWGAATAAYQIEGAATEGGRGPSIWDTFSHTPGRVRAGETGDVAADHYHRWAEDVELMRSLGLGAYRFSLSWSRIQPTGRGAVNPQGLAFYDRLIDGLLEAGIQPAITLYHWDLPQALEDAGGWPVRDTALRFADYAEIAHDAFGDRVDLWSTLNEPWCSANLGYWIGIHAPGRTEPEHAMAAHHHLLLGHGLATAAMRRTARAAERFAITLNLWPVLPASDEPADVAAATLLDAWSNRLYLDPLLRGEYPAEVLSTSTPLTAWDFVQDGDAATIAAPIDLLGVNYYAPHRVAAGVPTGGWLEHPTNLGVAWMPPQGELTDMGWEVCPSALTDLLVRLHEEYHTPLLITENGAAYPDVPDADGHVSDPQRVDYLAGHIGAVHQAMARGADVRGYMAWSLMDNFEWAEGYAKRFGLIRVDYDTLERRIKDSGHWYGHVARTGRLD